jgi:hypothetical protein
MGNGAKLAAATVTLPFEDVPAPPRRGGLDPASTHQGTGRNVARENAVTAGNRHRTRASTAKAETVEKIKSQA